MQSKIRRTMVMFVIVFMITITMFVPSIYGLMTKEKLNELLTKRGELIGQPYEPPVSEQGLEGLTHSQKLALLSNYTSPTALLT